MEEGSVGMGGGGECRMSEALLLYMTSKAVYSSVRVINSNTNLG